MLLTAASICRRSINELCGDTRNGSKMHKIEMNILMSTIRGRRDHLYTLLSKCVYKGLCCKRHVPSRLWRRTVGLTMETSPEREPNGRSVPILAYCWEKLSANNANMNGKSDVDNAYCLVKRWSDHSLGVASNKPCYRADVASNWIAATPHGRQDRIFFLHDSVPPQIAKKTQN